MPNENPEITIPKAVPDAGGCSASAMVIKKIDKPTASEYTTTDHKNDECGIMAHKEPEKKPIKCPPITRLGFAVILLGIAKTINAVDPIDAITTICSMLSKRSNRNIVNVARKH